MCYRYLAVFSLNSTDDDNTVRMFGLPFDLFGIKLIENTNNDQCLQLLHIIIIKLACCEPSVLLKHIIGQIK